MGDGVALDHVPQQGDIHVAFQQLVPVPSIQALRLRKPAADDLERSAAGSEYAREGTSSWYRDPRLEVRGLCGGNAAP